jgi:UDP-glucose 4-epimerase
MRALITGGAGFIGSHLAAHLGKYGTQVRVLDNFRTGKRRNLSRLDVELIEGSILDQRVVQRAVKGIDHVYHLAAFVSVPESVVAPRSCAEINVCGLLNVLEAAAQARVKKFCFASSAAVYGNSLVALKREDMPADPRSPYAVTKLDGEFYCRQFSNDRRLATVALRFFNVFGPRQDPDGPYGAVVPTFMREARAGRPLRIFGDGLQTRDFIYVQDIVSALTHVTIRPKLTGVFNAGYGHRTTVRELAERIIAIAASRSRIKYCAVRLGDVRNSRACIDRLLAAGWRPTGTLDEGLGKTYSALVGAS